MNCSNAKINEAIFAVGFVVLSLCFAFVDFRLFWLGVSFHASPLALLIVFLCYRKYYVLKKYDKK